MTIQARIQQPCVAIPPCTATLRSHANTCHNNPIMQPRTATLTTYATTYSCSPQLCNHKHSEALVSPKHSGAYVHRWFNCGTFRSISLVCLPPTPLSYLCNSVVCIALGSDLLTSNMMYATLPFLGSKREDKDTAARTSDAAKLLGVCRVLGCEGKISSCQVTGDSKEHGIESE